MLLNADLDIVSSLSFEVPCDVVAEGLSSIPFADETIFEIKTRLPAEVGISLQYLPLLSRVL